MKRLTIWWMMAVLVLLLWIGGCGTSPNGTTSDHVLPGKVPIQIDPNKMKDQQGQVIFIFQDDHNNKLTWKKKIILK
ncbi:hypothetical protein [Paenibacillus sp. UMB4589-SE434]|uniref:hypothetical protein n=1 Tax=Paenibacillus sp. UMB4589-SE434 TaxID=3046314 RepID=UPI00254F7F14|nr:hypothetical protein [Paenibacillus sp. UMB4589-SE434]MDK8179819.1 hypothetical protein [Paenibacillus sp. UMB4589-SE434]